MFVMDFDEEHKWHNARIVPYGPLPLDPAAAVLHYGQTMFEGLKAFRGADGVVRLFRGKDHCRRLNAGAARLCMPAIDPAMMLRALRELIAIDQDWVPSPHGTSLYVRPLMFGSEPFLGVRPAKRYVFLIILSAVGSYYGGGGIKPVKIWMEDQYVRAAPGALRAVKAAANYVTRLLAA